MGIPGSNWWRYVGTIFLAIFWGYISPSIGLKNRPKIYGIIGTSINWILKIFPLTIFDLLGFFMNFSRGFAHMVSLPSTHPHLAPGRCQRGLCGRFTNKIYGFFDMEKPELQPPWIKLVTVSTLYIVTKHRYDTMRSDQYMLYYIYILITTRLFTKSGTYITHVERVRSITSNTCNLIPDFWRKSSALENH